MNDSLFSNPELILEVREILAEETGRALAEVSDEEAREYLALSAAGPEAAFDTLHALFEAQAECSGEAVAVIAGDERLSYDELNRRANRLAHRLRRLGAGPGKRVGICVQRDADVLVTLLAVLKSGAAYVPLDPTYPKERLAFMLRDAEASVLISRGDLADPFDPRPEQVVCLDAEGPLLAEESDANPAPCAGPEDLAYVIYTSGSTGHPKGSMIHHRALCHYVPALQDRLPVGKDDVFLLTSSYSFAASHRQIWLPLSLGATVVIPSADEIRSPAQLLRRAKERGVTVLDLVPSYWQTLFRVLDELSPEEKADLFTNDVRCIFTASEPLYSNLAQTWRDAFGDATQTFNLYGQTETTGNVAGYPIPAEAPKDIRSVPIGRPLAGTRIYLSDSGFELAPLGVTGEIHVNCPWLSSGYLNHPRLTAERFVPDPWSDEPGARVYKTGDLARYLADENLSFLGRGDQQVKVHGLRVEPGEIEALLREHPHVRQAVVTATEDRTGNVRLVAYLVPEPGCELPAAELRSALRSQLPDFMVPSTFLTLDSLPLTSTGKLNRKALPAPDSTLLHERREVVAPRNAVERQLAAIWCEVLDLDEVGVDDSFFLLGGDSILAIRMIAKARLAGLDLVARQLMKHQTLAGLAAQVGTARAIGTEQGLVTGPVPLSPSQRRFFEAGGPGLNRYDQAVMLALHERVGPAVFDQALHHLLLHHDALRLRFHHGEKGWAQRSGGQEAARPPFSRVDLSRLPPARRGDARRTAASQVRDTLNLTAGPLLRVVLFQQGDDDTEHLLVVMHHLVFDGLSWRLVLGDFHELCRQAAAGEEPRLPPKTTSFKAYAERLLEHARSSDLAAERAFWLTDDYAETRPLPVIAPDGDNTMSSQDTIFFALSPEETQSLCHDAPAAFDVTTEEILLTAVVRAFEPWTGQRSLLIESARNGRQSMFEDVDLSRTVGWIGDNCPIFLDLGPDDDLLAQLRSIRDRMRRLPNGGTGYGLLRHLCGDEEVAKRLCKVQPEVFVSYWGHLDSLRDDTSALFELVDEFLGMSTHPLRPRNWQIYVAIDVIGGRLRVRFRYSRGLHKRRWIKSLAQRFLAALHGYMDAAAGEQEQAPVWRTKLDDFQEINTSEMRV